MQVSTRVEREIERRLLITCRKFGVSRSFVQNTALALLFDVRVRTFYDDEA